MRSNWTDIKATNQSVFSLREITRPYFIRTSLGRIKIPLVHSEGKTLLVLGKWSWFGNSSLEFGIH